MIQNEENQRPHVSYMQVVRTRSSATTSLGETETAALVARPYRMAY